MHFTRKTIASLNLPAGKPYIIYWDADLPGFGIRLNPTSSVWVVQYRLAGRTRRETIGRVDAVSLEGARDSAKKVLARVQLGGDPRADRQNLSARQKLLFGSVVSRYLATAKDRLKKRSFEEVSRHLLKHWSGFNGVPFQEIDRRLISARLEELTKSSGPIAANRARAALSGLFAYGLSSGIADTNPVIGTQKYGVETQRDHVISDAEIKAIWEACADSEYGRMIQLLLLTGQRRDEIGGMRWSEVDLDQALWIIPASRTKNGRTHEVPLSTTALDIIRRLPRIIDRDPVFGSGIFGFSGWSKAKTKLDGLLQSTPEAVRPWRLHDLRRTAATGMANIGQQPHIIEAVLNHISGTRSGVAGIYNRATYRLEKRNALGSWADHIFRLIHERKK